MKGRDAYEKSKEKVMTRGKKRKKGRTRWKTRSTKAAKGGRSKEWKCWRGGQNL